MLNICIGVKVCWTTIGACGPYNLGGSATLSSCSYSKLLVLAYSSSSKLSRRSRRDGGSNPEPNCPIASHICLNSSLSHALNGIVANVTKKEG